MKESKTDEGNESGLLAENRSKRSAEDDKKPSGSTGAQDDKEPSEPTRPPRKS